MAFCPGLFFVSSMVAVESPSPVDFAAAPAAEMVEMVVLAMKKPLSSLRLAICAN
jgi:hypothetical protein